MKIKSDKFCVRPGEKVALEKWPTRVKPFCRSKKQYHSLLAEQVEELSSLQRLHYAYIRTGEAFGYACVPSPTRRPGLSRCLAVTAN